MINGSLPEAVKGNNALQNRQPPREYSIRGDTDRFVSETDSRGEMLDRRGYNLSETDSRGEMLDRRGYNLSETDSRGEIDLGNQPKRKEFGADN